LGWVSTELTPNADRAGPDARMSSVEDVVPVTTKPAIIAASSGSTYARDEILIRLDDGAPESES
jgi:hypothetical protein